MFSLHLQNSIRGLLDALFLVTGSFAAVWLLPSGVLAQEAAPSPSLTPMPSPTATAFVGIFLLSGEVLKAAAPKVLWNPRNMSLQPPPVLGTWVGTVLVRAGIGGNKW